MSYKEKFIQYLKSKDLIYSQNVKTDLEGLFEQADNKIRILQNKANSLERLELENMNDNERLQQFLEHLKRNPHKPF